MNLRLATMEELPQLRSIYEKVIDNMNKNNIAIWDEVYPCEFFHDDIINNRLYVLVENNNILASFTLCESCPGEECISWTNNKDKFLYIDRVGVNVDYLRKGVGSKLINQAISLAKEKEAKYVRLFVVDINEPAIQLYKKNGFKRMEGIYDEKIEDDFVLHEYGFEIEITA